MTTVPVFKGVGTALVTPFTREGIDFASFAKLIEMQLSNGVDALVVCGTTGEGATMSFDEKKAAIEFVIKQTRRRVPVIAGTGSNNIADACRLSEFACNAGASALLVVTPYYNKTTQTGLYESYSAVSESSDKPIIVYNVPSRTGVNISPSQYAELCSIPGIYGVKEANGDLSKFAEAYEKCGDKLYFYSGSDELLLPFLSLGAAGVISVASNILPKKLKRIYTAFISGDFRKAYQMQKELTPIEKALFCETNPIPVKTALFHMGYCRKIYRLPLTEMEESNEKTLLEAMKKEGLEINGQQSLLNSTGINKHG